MKELFKADIAVADRVAEERATAERKRKEREEAHLYMDVQVASEANFRLHQGFDVVPWKGDPDSPALPKLYRILRATSMSQFTQRVAEDLGVEADMIRSWAMVNRQNGTVRPDVPIPFPDMTVEEAANKYGTKTSSFRLWIEKAEKRDEEGNPLFGDKLLDLKNPQNNRPLMLFLKHFDPKTQSLFGIGNLYAGYQDKVVDMSPQILKLMGWPPGTTFKLSEVSDFSPLSTLSLTNPGNQTKHDRCYEAQSHSFSIRNTRR